jgi:hypothetical protein
MNTYFRTQPESELRSELQRCRPGKILYQAMMDRSLVRGLLVGRLYVRKLTNYSLGLFASKSYLSSHPPIVDRDSLRQHRFIGYIDELIHMPELDSGSPYSRR